MSVGKGPERIAFTASEPIAQHAAVLYNTTSNKIENCDAAADEIFGFALEAAAADGDEITVSFEPVTYARLSGTVEPGQDLMCDSGTPGQLIIHDAVAGSVFAAVALADGVSGDVIPVKVNRNQKVTS